MESFGQIAVQGLTVKRDRPSTLLFGSSRASRVTSSMLAPLRKVTIDGWVMSIGSPVLALYHCSVSCFFIV